MIENPVLNMSCPAVLSRINRYPTMLKPLKRGVAFARIVFSDYEFIEKQVEMSFHPQNVFCFVVDKNSDDTFQQRMKRMAECVGNVHVLPGRAGNISDKSGIFLFIDFSEFYGNFFLKFFLGDFSDFFDFFRICN